MTSLAWLPIFVNMTAKIALLSIMHESNTFAEGVTTFEHFKQRGFHTGPELLDFYRGGNSSLSAAIKIFEEANISMVPIIATGATPGPVVSKETLLEIWEIAKAEIQNQLPFDGVYISHHGAALAEDEPDMDGWIFEQLRGLIGSDIPVIGTLDPHCAFSNRMIQHTTALLPYKTNPHVDAHIRGLKAAQLLLDTLAGKVSPTQSVVRPPMIINIERQDSSSSPLKELCDACTQAESQPGILDASLTFGYPYSDIDDMGTTIQVISNNDLAQASKTATELARQCWDQRETLLPSLLTSEEAVKAAVAIPRPVCLLDMGDNIGGGSSGIGTWLIPPLLKYPDIKVFFSLYAPELAAKCIEAGVGAEVEFTAGGNAPKIDGPSFDFKGKVFNIPPTEFTDDKIRHGGQNHFKIGPSALVVDNNFYLLLMGNRAALRTHVMLQKCGVEATDFDIIVAKGVNAPMAAFDGLVVDFVKANTPGTTSADLFSFDYQHLRHPLHPFDAEADFDAHHNVITGS